MSKILKILFIILFSTNHFLYGTNTQSAQKADLIIFSFDRPLQLYALLESLETYVTGIETTQILYRSSSDAYTNAYQEVFKKFNWATPLPQGRNPYADFKPLLLKAFFDSPSSYIIFAVDDIIVKDFINISECINMIEFTGAYGFYLRMGIHLSESYPAGNTQKLPPFQHIQSDIYAWCFKDGETDWRYPHTVDMTLFRKKDIAHDIQTIYYKAPNSLEANWQSTVAPIIEKHFGLCYEHTKAVSIPLNLVQQEWFNPHMNLLSANELLALFNKGLKMDISPLFQIMNKGAHMDYTPTFTIRR